MKCEFHLIVVAVVFLVLVTITHASQDKKKDNEFPVGAVGRMAVEGAVAAAPTLVGKATMRAGTIRYATKAVGAVAKGVLPSKTWRAAAVFGGTRISNYLTSSWLPYVSAGLMAYDGYQLVKWMLSDESSDE